MTWQEFRQWALETLGFTIDAYSTGPSTWRVVWGTDAIRRPSTFTGSGNPATYGPTQQRRLAMWLRARDLVHRDVLTFWLEAAELHNDGWLVNDGSGIRWEADPDPVELVKRGFVAIKCGI